jgi:hypothetical protein
VEKDITFLSPFRLDGVKLGLFEHTVNSYYDSFGENRPLHLICDDSDSDSHWRAKNILENRTANVKYLEPAGSMINAVVKLIEAVKTPYFAFITDDVCLITERDIWSACLYHLKHKNKCVQIKIGGGAVSDGPNNRSNLYRVTNQPVYLRQNPYSDFDCVRLGNPEKDAVWTESLESKKQRGVFPLSYYNCVMRTDFFHRIHEIIKPRITAADKTWSDYLAKTNKCVGISDDVYNTGWPEGLSFINEYRSGWLNFCNYIYCFGRYPQSLEDFKKSHTEEIRAYN